MRILLLGAATIALSGCTWLPGFGHQSNNQMSQHGYYSSGDKCCVGGKSLSRWNVEGAVGPQFIVGGDSITGDRTNDVAGEEAENVSWDSAFDRGVRYELGTSYALNPNRKVTLMGHYAEADGENVTLGSVGGDVISGEFSDYESYGVEAGLRQYFRPSYAPIVGSVRPYVEGRVGATHIDDIAVENATLASGGAWLGGTVPMYDGGWVPTGAGLIGVEAPVFNRATLALETGVRYTGTLESDNSVLSGGAPLAGINNGSDNWTVPVMLRGRYRF